MPDSPRAQPEVARDHPLTREEQGNNRRAPGRVRQAELFDCRPRPAWCKEVCPAARKVLLRLPREYLAEMGGIRRVGDEPQRADLALDAARHLLYLLDRVASTCINSEASR